MYCTSNQDAASKSCACKRFFIFCWRMDRFGTFKRNISELNGIFSREVRRMRWKIIGAATASAPNRNNGARKLMAEDED